ncbi:MAG: hypothetical protein ACOY3Z_10925 [Thermodesulfobacteriota bacterium]
MIKKWWLTVLMLPFLGACGTTVVDTVHPVVRTASVGEAKKMVILPFADHTPGDSPYGYWHRNVLINEAVQDEILRYGYVPAPQEDVIDYLSRKNIIQDVDSSRNASGATTQLESELGKGWSEAMKTELLKAVHNNVVQARERKPEKYWNSERMIALDHQRIRELGSRFGADYIMRGRVITLKKGQADSFNPMQTGILPFFFKAGSRTVFGMAQSDTYEMIDKMAIGGLLGAMAASDDWPVDSSSTTAVGGSPRFGGSLVTETSSSSGFNNAIWGVAGAGLAHLAHKGGRVDMATVQLRMVVQDAYSGEIVWTNRAEVEVSPRSAYGEHDENKLIAQAIQQASARLVDNFIASQTGRKVVRTNPDGTLYVTAAGGAKAPDYSSPSSTIFVDTPKVGEYDHPNIQSERQAR